MADILAVIETRAGAVRKGAAELLVAARRLADASGGTVDALLCVNGPLASADTSWSGGRRPCAYRQS